MSLIRNLSAKIPETKAAKKPTISGTIPTEEVTSPRSFASRINAPRTAGIESMKEYSQATFLSMPQKREAEIVVPEREIPGRVPSP